MHSTNNEYLDSLLKLQLIEFAFELSFTIVQLINLETIRFVSCHFHKTVINDEKKRMICNIINS